MPRFINRQRLFLFLGDIALFILATRISAWIRLPHIDIFRVHTGATVITVAMYPVFLYVFNLYHLPGLKYTGNMTLRAAMAVLFASAPIGFLFYSIPQWKYGRGIWLIQMIFVWCFVVLWRITVSRTILTHNTADRLLILGAGEAGRFFHDWVCESDPGYEIVGFLDDDPKKLGKAIGSTKVLGTSDRLTEIGQRERVSKVLLAIRQRQPKNLIRTVLDARLNGWRILELSRVYEENTGRVPVRYIEDEWLLYADGFYLLGKPFLQKVKRLVDFFSAVALLVLTSPIMAVTAVAIRLTSTGPVIYRQKRVGRNDKVFELLKFRSMRVDAENNGAVWAQEDDTRVTFVGRIIRLLRIDELPQLYNILKNDMSLIGPRPERPEFVSELENQVPYYFIRHTVKPGITGWAQVNYRYGASVEDALNKLEFDIYYIKNMSFLLEIAIVLRTVGVVLLGQGAR